MAAHLIGADNHEFAYSNDGLDNRSSNRAIFIS
jgi:hypothetical protein